MTYRPQGLGDALSDAMAQLTPEEQEQVATVLLYEQPDLMALAVQDGIIPAGAAGADLFHQVGDALLQGEDAFTHALLTYPALTALQVAGQEAVSSVEDLHLDTNTILMNLTGPPGATPTFETGREIPADILNEAGAYVAALQRYVPLLINDYLAYNGDTAARNLAELTLAYDLLNQKAVNQGTITFAGHPIAASQVAEGPITLPDGSSYVIVNQPTAEDLNAYYVLWDFSEPATLVPGFIRPGECNTVAGTGAWYAIGALGGICPLPPPGYTGGFGLISPRALASLQLSSQNMAPPPAGGSGSVQTTYTGPTVPPVITQDQNGDPISDLPVTVDNGVTITPPVLIGTLPGTVAPAAKSDKMLLLTVAGIALALIVPPLLSRGRRR